MEPFQNYCKSRTFRLYIKAHLTPLRQLIKYVFDESLSNSNKIQKKKTQENKLTISVDEFQQYELQQVRLICTQNPD